MKIAKIALSIVDFSSIQEKVWFFYTTESILEAGVSVFKCDLPHVAKKSLCGDIDERRVVWWGPRPDYDVCASRSRREASSYYAVCYTHATVNRRQARIPLSWTSNFARPHLSEKSTYGRETNAILHGISRGTRLCPSHVSLPLHVHVYDYNTCKRDIPVFVQRHPNIFKHVNNTYQ